MQRQKNMLCMGRSFFIIGKSFGLFYRIKALWAAHKGFKHLNNEYKCSLGFPLYGIIHLLWIGRKGKEDFYHE